MCDMNKFNHDIYIYILCVEVKMNFGKNGGMGVWKE